VSLLLLLLQEHRTGTPHMAKETLIAAAEASKLTGTAWHSELLLLLLLLQEHRTGTPHMTKETLIAAAEDGILDGAA
jgi:hypothetical protein